MVRISTRPCRALQNPAGCGMLHAMRLERVLETLNELAPPELAEDWDRVGLQLGDPAWNVRRAMLCIDLTEPVLAEAVAKKVNLIVAYHPPIFEPIKNLANWSRHSWKQRIILELARRRIAIYSPHTALDAARDGVNEWLCAGIGKGKTYAIHPVEHGSEDQYKIVAFIPAEHVARLRAAMSEAGAGCIGNYVECSFGAAGQGTFHGTNGADPFVGKTGQLEHVDEMRMEMVCQAGCLNRVIEELRKAHPYEEPAFDIYKLVPAPTPMYEEAGQGRSLTLDRPITVATLIQRIKKHLGVTRLDVAMPDKIAPDGYSPGKIQIVAVCAGAGGSVLKNEACVADAYFTGEMRHHGVLDAVQQGKVVILAGHTQTERPYLPVYRQRLTRACGRGVQWIVSRRDRSPSQIA